MAHRGSSQPSYAAPTIGAPKSADFPDTMEPRLNTINLIIPAAWDGNHQLVLARRGHLPSNRASRALNRFCVGQSGVCGITCTRGDLGNETLALKDAGKNGKRPWQPNALKTCKTPSSITSAKQKSRSPYFWSTG